MPRVARSGVFRNFNILPAMALVACTATGPTIGSDASSDAETDGDAETNGDSETGEDGSETDDGDGETDDGDGETDDGTLPEPDMPGEPGPCNLEHCGFGNVCVEDECVEIKEPSACVAPVMVALPQPGANGRVVALDLVDLQNDGDVEIVAWLDGVGIGVLDDLQWTKSEYLPAGTDISSIAAVHADDDDLLDVVLNDGDNLVRVGIGVGAGNFEMASAHVGISSMRAIAFAPDHRRAFGKYQGTAAYLRFSVFGNPTVVELSAVTQKLFPAQLDGTASEDMVFSDGCDAYASRIDADGGLHSRLVQIDAQRADSHSNGGGLCFWASADFDGDDREELIAAQELHYGGGFPQEMLLTVLPNTSQADVGLPSFDTPQRTKVPGVNVPTIAGDFDGDGDDELLLTDEHFHSGGGTLVWASEGQLPSCMAELPNLPDEVQEFRTGDIDGDGDDELVLFRDSGELRVLDFQ